jgi:hypothetical protein
MRTGKEIAMVHKELIYSVSPYTLDLCLKAQRLKGIRI